MNNKVVTLLFALLVAVVSPARAWDKTGHMIIAQVAYDHLTPTAKAESERLIKVFASDPDVAIVPMFDRPYNFVTASAWMDDIKGFDNQFNTWHYIDLPYNEKHLTTPEDVRAFRDANPNNSYLAIQRNCIPVLRSATASDQDKARALAMLLHLAGDIHQPLHTTGRDRGGNTVPIEGVPSADQTWKITNLHAFWDNAYRYKGDTGANVLSIGVMDQPRKDILPDSGPLKSAADQMARNFPMDPRLAAQLDPAVWAAQTNQYVADTVYADLIVTLDPGYVERARRTASAQLVLAGDRLAGLLNSLFDPHSSGPVL